MPAALRQLAITRPVFHSEADFQYALAWTLQQRRPDRRIRLEYRPDIDEVMNVDIVVTEPTGHVCAIELKYWTKALTAHVDGEAFKLRTQGAHDLCRYDFIKDITRVERLVDVGVANDGWVAAITNDPAYWKPSARPDTIDVDLRLTQGRTLTGVLGWAPDAGPGTTKGRTAAHVLAGSYTAAWSAYSTVPSAGPVEFRILCLQIGANGGAAHGLQDSSGGWV
jgi:hypothetical protein